MAERCGACGTDGVTNSMGRFVSNDWLRASELNGKLNAALAELAEVKAKMDRLADAASDLLLAYRGKEWRTIEERDSVLVVSSVLASLKEKQ